jgi:dipeptidyl aminopeptidase/acylaminoacyl peptidase
MILVFVLSAFAAEPTYQQPPESIQAILDADSPPAVMVSPDRGWMLEMERPNLRPLSELAEPSVKVAGIQINPETNGPAREYAYRGIVLRDMASARKAKRVNIDLPEGARVRNVDWNFDSTGFSFTLTQQDGIELWFAEVPSGTVKRLTGPVLNAAYGSPCDWLPADRGLVCKQVPSARGAAPEESRVPTGPVVDENLGRKAPARTYSNLLKSPHDEALFEHYLQSELVHVALDGAIKKLTDADIVDEATPSPDGEWLMVQTLHRPWSYHVSASRFPTKMNVRRLDDPTGVIPIEELKLADDIPIARGSVRTGKRSVSWRADHPATLYAIEALDGGDAAAEAEKRDRVSMLSAPFDGDFAPMWDAELRIDTVMWGDEDFAMAWTWRWNDRQLRMWRLDPSGKTEPALMNSRSFQDNYADPGSPMSWPGPHGWGVIHQVDGGILMSGRGIRPDGVHPFLDVMDLETGESRNLWKAGDTHHETLTAVMDAEATGFITRRQSQKSPPNYQRRTAGSSKTVGLTNFKDWAPQFASVQKELVTYTRADGLELQARVYTPPGWRPSHGPLPTVFWAYPNEFKSKKDAGQKTKSENLFSRPSTHSPLWFCLQGYAVVDDPTLPIVGEGDIEPNDNFVEQLVSGAEAAVKMAVEKGVADPNRLLVGGHSYGAFMTANLLAHTDLFQAGIARSGAYNRSLTPFGFQAEQRTYWEALDTYIEMSPFTHANRIDEPILLIHGAVDPNPGTYPVQSERLFEAIKGNGGTVRWVVLPLEEHGYRARESIGHMLWEQFRWADTYVKNAEARPSNEDAEAN